MARTPPRHQRPPHAPATKHVAAKPVDVHADAADRASTDALELTRRMFGASLATSQAWMKGLCEMQQTQAAALQSATTRVGDAAERAADAPDWASLLSLQADLASSQWADALQDAAHQWNQWMDVESRLLERARVDVVRLSQRWLDGSGTAWSSMTPMLDADSLTAADSDTPLAMLGQAQTAWSEMLRVWTQGANFAALRE